MSAEVLTALPVDALRTSRIGATGGVAQAELLTGGGAVMPFTLAMVGMGSAFGGTAELVVTPLVVEAIVAVGTADVGLPPQVVAAAAPPPPPDAIPVEPPPAWTLAAAGAD
ncbi:MAG: hypothetical protein WBE92_15330, partial [Steroidobacteraceae bacterium]